MGFVLYCFHIMSALSFKGWKSGLGYNWQEQHFVDMAIELDSNHICDFFRKFLIQPIFYSWNWNHCKCSKAWSLTYRGPKSRKCHLVWNAGVLPCSRRLFYVYHLHTANEKSSVKQGAIHIFILTEAMREQKIHNAREVRGL